MEAGTQAETRFEPAGVAPAQRFSLREAARILGLPEVRLRALARGGLLAAQRGPLGPPAFGYHDLLVCRATQSLALAGVPLRRIRRTWAAVRKQLEAGRALTHLQIEADGDEVVATDGVSRWRPDSGQVVLDFETVLAPDPAPARLPPTRLSLVENAAPARPDPEAPRSHGFVPVLLVSRPTAAATSLERALPAAAGPSLTAEDWYELGCELELSDTARARDAYEKAIDLDPGLADAHVNLGRHWHVAGERGRAEPHYREAVRLAPEDPTPHFNLGVLLDELGRKEEAILAYRQALQRDPEFTDAHCNLGLLLESLGRRQEAMRHLIAAHQAGPDDLPQDD
jgi:tetratricopeptide (TPR) repeat protein